MKSEIAATWLPKLHGSWKFGFAQRKRRKIKQEKRDVATTPWRVAIFTRYHLFGHVLKLKRARRDERNIPSVINSPSVLQIKRIFPLLGGMFCSPEQKTNRFRCWRAFQQFPRGLNGVIPRPAAKLKRTARPYYNREESSYSCARQEVSPSETAARNAKGSRRGREREREREWIPSDR